MPSRALTLYKPIPAVSGAIDALTIWNDPVAKPGWGEEAWKRVSSIVTNQGGDSTWAKYVGEFAKKTWQTEFGKKAAAIAMRRFFDTAASPTMNPKWHGGSEVTVLNDAAHHETSQLSKELATKFFSGFGDMEDGKVAVVGAGGAPDVTPGGGKGLLVKAGQMGLSYLSGNDLDLRGQLIALGKTEIGPLMQQAFKKLPHDAWMKAIDKEWDVEDAHFVMGERVVTQSGRMAVVKNINLFKPDVITVTLNNGEEIDVAAHLLNRSFKRGEWAWTARFEPLANKVVKSIGLITRIIKVNVFYQVRKLSDGTDDLYLAKHMMPMELKYQAVLDTTPMAVDFKTASLFDNTVKLNPCNLPAKMANSLAMHEGGAQTDKKMARDLQMVGDANANEMAIAADAADAPGMLTQGADMPWRHDRAQKLIKNSSTVAKTGQGWFDWLFTPWVPKQPALTEGRRDFPKAIQEKGRRRLVAQNKAHVDRKTAAQVTEEAGFHHPVIDAQNKISNAAAPAAKRFQEEHPDLDMTVEESPTCPAKDIGPVTDADIGATNNKTTYLVVFLLLLVLALYLC